MLLSFLKTFCENKNIEYFGVLPASLLRFIKEPPVLPFAPVSAFVALFPYYTGRFPKNLSLYCALPDYHQVIGNFLQELITRLLEKDPSARFYSFCDVSPLDEVAAAEAAGLGSRGQNNLLLNEKYGTYCFIGGFLTDRALPEHKRPRKNLCTGCGQCLAACPGGAISIAGCAMPVFHPDLCLSALTQKKGELTLAERALIRQNGLAFGCDVCQRVCPVNRNVETTPFLPFQQDFLPELTLADLEGLSDRAFRKKYKARAFSWRGLGPVKRNLELLE